MLKRWDIWWNKVLNSSLKVSAVSLYLECTLLNKGGRIMEQDTKVDKSKNKGKLNLSEPLDLVEDTERVSNSVSNSKDAISTKDVKKYKVVVRMYLLSRLTVKGLKKVKVKKLVGFLNGVQYGK